MLFSKTQKPKSELRFDPINKDWVVVAEGRGRRPEDFKKKTTDASQGGVPMEQVVDNMPFVFCDYFIKPEFLDKNFAVIPNKFPAFSSQKNREIKSDNFLFQKMLSVGFHEVVVFNDHSKQLTDFSQTECEELLDVYQQKYIELSKEKAVNYISIFHNHGKNAGASLVHPHSQIIAIPFFDKNLSVSLNSAKDFFKEKSQCLFCATNRAEKQRKVRIKNYAKLKLIHY